MTTKKPREEWGVKWSEFVGNGNLAELVVKEKICHSQKALNNFKAKVQDRGGFNEFIAWLIPKGMAVCDICGERLSADYIQKYQTENQADDVPVTCEGCRDKAFCRSWESICRALDSRQE